MDVVYALSYKGLLKNNVGDPLMEDFACGVTGIIPSYYYMFMHTSIVVDRYTISIHISDVPCPAMLYMYTITTRQE